MTLNHDDNAGCWRDLIDQLTPGQIAELEYCEREQVPSGLATPRGHLNCARKMAEVNLARQMFADVAPPADAIEVDDWSDWDDEVYVRAFTSWVSSNREVSLVGSQFSDGRVERCIMCDTEIEHMTAAEAYGLASALSEAADRLAQLP